MEQPTDTCASNVTAADEIEGYLQLGMQREAEACARLVLAGKRTSIRDFRAAIEAVLQSRSPARWRRLVEAAAARVPGRRRQGIEASMMNFYLSVHDYESALQWFPTRQRVERSDLYVMMQIALETGRADLADDIAARCRRALRRAKRDTFEFIALSDALATYHARKRDWSEAEKLWRAVPLEPALARNILCGIVAVQAARALVAARMRLDVIADLRASPDLVLELQTSGNHDALLDCAEKELRKMIRGLERAIPRDAYTAVGVELPASGAARTSRAGFAAVSH